MGARQGANLTFTIKLVSPQIDPVVVSYQTADGTAAQTVDYISKSGSLTFAPGETSKSMNVETLIFTAATNEKKLKLLVEAQMGSVQEATETEATINPVATVAKYKSVSSSGGSYSCGITFSDTVQCWGRYPKNIASLTG
ncbi:MAG: Calx-beta domain-containing protein, partial [Bdellovibrionota bacterium]